MKKPSRKRTKKLAPHEQVAASPFDPVPVRTRTPKAKKQPKAPKQPKQPRPSKQPRRSKRQRQLTPQELAAAAATPSQPSQAKQASQGKGGGRVRRLGRALSSPVRVIGRKLAGLRGPVRIIVYFVIAVVVVVAALQLRGGRDDAKLVRQALVRYEKASRDKDYQTLCDDLLASSYVKQTASSGLPCEVALKTALQNVRDPTLQVLSVEVNGNRAAASVSGSAAGQVPGKAVYTLVREDGAWKILPPRPTSAADATP